MVDGRVNKCKECNKKDVRDNYAKRSDYYHKYDRDRQRLNIKRIFSQRYNSIKSRCEPEYSSAKSRYYRVTGTEYLTREEFIKWTEDTMDSFMIVYSKWVESNFDKKEVPSIDRIDNNVGYIASNMQWLSRSDNAHKFNNLDSPNNWEKGYKTRHGKDYI